MRFVAVIPAVLLASANYAAVAKGRVTTTSGAPIAGASIITWNLVEATTMRSGEYRLPEQSNVLIFFAIGYAPVIKTVSEARSVVDVVLERAGASEWHVPACSTSVSNQHRIGSGAMRFAVTGDVETFTHTDTDFIRIVSYYGTLASPMS